MKKFLNRSLKVNPIRDKVLLDLLRKFKLGKEHKGLMMIFPNA